MVEVCAIDVAIIKERVPTFRLLMRYSGEYRLAEKPLQAAEDDRREWQADLQLRDVRSLLTAEKGFTLLPEPKFQICILPTEPGQTTSQIDPNPTPVALRCNAKPDNGGSALS